MHKFELVAPVGNRENFFAAMEAGADAVYVGAPGFNARNIARDLQLEDIGAMIAYCRAEGKKIYIAANSLILERELPHVIKSLSILEKLQPDALIVQDLGIIHLVRQYFPELKLHASTLMTAHNSDTVLFLASLGCELVVLARELTLKEISAISSRCGETRLEVFVHGAMCFSYSGLCLFSSYLGGKSGLRGKCVQPCRRAYTPLTKSKKGVGKKIGGGYLFSMNDLSGFDALPGLLDAGVSSLKIEGRLRSAHYIKHIVRAYRTVLDCSPENRVEAVAEAESLADEAMSRKVSSGYFFSPQPAEAITPYHSGNTGIHLGRFSVIKEIGDGYICKFILKSALAQGDRIRLHSEPSGERVAFRLRKLFVAGEEQEKALAGQRVTIELPIRKWNIPPRGHIEVYKVDSGLTAKGHSQPPLALQSSRKQIEIHRESQSARVDSICQQVCRESGGEKNSGVEKKKIRKQQYFKKNISNDMPLEWWLKTDSIKSVQGQLPFSPNRFLLSFEKQLVGQAGQIKKYLGREARKVIWALPPLIMENDLSRSRKQIQQLIRSGYRDFQIGHISQVGLFRNEKVRLFANYTVNIMNSRAFDLVGEIGFDGAQLGIEMDKDSLAETLSGYREMVRNVRVAEKNNKFTIGLTVYGAPPLFTSRLSSSHFQFEKPVLSPRQEPFIIRKKEGFTQTFAQKPFSLLPWLFELKEIGIDYVVVDISSGATGKRELLELKERLGNTGKYGKLSTFNYFGQLD